MDKNKQKRIFYLSLGIIAVIVFYAFKNTSYFVRLFGFLLSIIIFAFGDDVFRIDFQLSHYIIFILISGAGILLSPLYYISALYDKSLHLLTPILLGALVFFIVDRWDLKFYHKLLVTFTFLIATLALFEIGEFTLDHFFDLKLQGVYLRDISGVNKLNIVMDRNDDTMIDLILGTFGSLIFLGGKGGIHCYKEYLKKYFEKSKKGK